jgi:hypothetical protein
MCCVGGGLFLTRVVCAALCCVHFGGAARPRARFDSDADNLVPVASDDEGSDGDRDIGAKGKTAIPLLWNCIMCRHAVGLI